MNYLICDSNHFVWISLCFQWFWMIFNRLIIDSNHLERSDLWFRSFHVLYLMRFTNAIVSRRVLVTAAGNRRSIERLCRGFASTETQLIWSSQIGHIQLGYGPSRCQWMLNCCWSLTDEERLQLPASLATRTHLIGL